MTTAVANGTTDTLTWRFCTVSFTVDRSLGRMNSQYRPYLRWLSLSLSNRPRFIVCFGFDFRGRGTMPFPPFNVFFFFFFFLVSFNFEIKKKKTKTTSCSLNSNKLLRFNRILLWQKLKVRELKWQNWKLKDWNNLDVLKNVIEGDIPIVFDILHLILVTLRLLQCLDDQSRCRWHHWHLGLTILHSQLHCGPIFGANELAVPTSPLVT